MPDLAPDDPRHGTYAGYVAGCREPDCRNASAAYQAAYRKASPRARQQHADDHRARRRAYCRLADIYPGLYRALYVEELAAIKRSRADA